MVMDGLEISNEWQKSGRVYTRGVGRSRRGNRFVVPLIFKKKLVDFSLDEMRFIQAWGPGVGVVAACKVAGISEEVGFRCLRRRNVGEFLEDRAILGAVKAGWTEDRWVMEGDLIYSGLKVPTAEQMTVWKEFGDRLMPKVRKFSGGGEVRPSVNISIENFHADMNHQVELEGRLAVELETGGVRGGGVVVDGGGV